MAMVQVSPKGQVVIPAKIRKELNIKPKTRLEIYSQDDKIIAFPIPDDPIEALCGIFRDGPSLTEALLETRKEELEYEEKKIARFLRTSKLPEQRRGISEG